MIKYCLLVARCMMGMDISVDERKMMTAYLR